MPPIPLPVITTAEGLLSLMAREYAAPDARKVVANRPAAKINAAKHEL
jgi:hypothetical protein